MRHSRGVHEGISVMTLNNAMIGLLALAMFAAAMIVSMGPLKGGVNDSHGYATHRTIDR